MFVDNRSAFGVRATCTPCSDTRAIGFATFRACYQLGPAGLVPGERLPVQSDALSGMPTCIGTSWSIAGTAVPARPVRELSAEVRVADRAPLGLRVLGDRVWQRRGDTLSPSDPLPFERMSLGCERAFGGTVRLPAGERDGLPHPALELAHPANPRGRGYFIDARQAEGGACPNLEFGGSHLTSWPQEPDPAVLSPDGSQLAARLADGGRQLQREPELAALRLCHPGHWRSFGPALRPDDTIAFSGLRRDALAFSVPASPVRVEVRQGRVWHHVGFHVRHIHVALDQARIEVVFGHSASYSKSQPLSDMRIREAA